MERLFAALALGMLALGGRHYYSHMKSKKKDRLRQAKLEVLSGGTFDKSYIKGQIKAHEDTVDLFQKEIASGKDADAKAFAKESLPTIRSHLKAIRAIAASVGVSK